MIYFDVREKTGLVRVEVEECTPTTNPNLSYEVLSRVGGCIQLETCLALRDGKTDPVPYLERDLRKEFEDVRFVSSDWYPNKPQVIY